MKKFYIVPNTETHYGRINADSKEQALEKFADSMDSDISSYFDAVRKEPVKHPQFAEPLEGKILTAFTAFLKSLPMTEIRSILKIWMWLYQHDISFQMKFTWNKNRSMLYNLRRIYEPRRINKRLNRFRHEDLMAYSFED